MKEQKINEENIENNRVFCIDRPKTFATRSIQRYLFLNASHRPKEKICLFSISFFFFFFISVYL